jgi:argininosuccinate synthase
MGEKIDPKAVEKRIMDAPGKTYDKVAVAYSGGLDSSLGIEIARRKYKAKEVIAVSIDVGQGEDEVQMARDKAKILKIEPVFIDARKEFTEEWLPKAIRANSDYNGYPVSTSMTRQLIARIVAQEAVKRGATALMEGSTGKGNDQYRMHNVFTTFAPGLDILCFVRDFDMTRLEERELSTMWGIPISELVIGGDKTMWCHSIGSGSVMLNDELPPEVWMWLTFPWKAPDKGEEFTIKFEAGIPVELNGKAMPLAKIIDELNLVGGRNGVGYIDMFEDGMACLKSREIYEAPAAHIILKLHRDLEANCLTKDEIFFKKTVDERWAYMVYHGEWYHPLKRALDAFVAETQPIISGSFKVRVYKGNIHIVERTLGPGSLFAPEIRDIKRKSFDQRWSANAAKIRGMQFEILAMRDKKVAAAGQKPAVDANKAKKK